MADGKIKVAVIRSAAAVLCTAIAAYSGISNTNKICENKLKISSGAVEKADGGVSSTQQEFDEQFADLDTDEQVAESDMNTDTDDSAAVYDVSDEGTTAQSENTDTTKKNDGTSKTDAPKKKITLTGGLNSTNKEEILEYYKLVSKKNEKVLFKKTLSLDSFSPGKTLNISEGWLDLFTKAAKRALAKNTVTNEPYPGKPENIRASDWQAAKAVNDGTNTTIYIKVVPQTDGYNGSIFEGTCGRSMSVLDGLDRALQDLPASTVDFSTAKMTIQYQNPTIKLTVSNATGELVKNGCEWKYRTVINIESIHARVAGIKIHLEEAGGIVDYSVAY